MSRNIPPTVLTTLAAQSPLELAFNTRRRQLGRTADAALISGRGRLLSRAWLAQAETFTAADAAWFRAPITGGK